MIRLIAAVDQKLGITKGGLQPWKLPADEQYFAEQTKLRGGIVLVGLTTFKTFKAPLTERQNFVVTHETSPIPGVELVHDIDAFLAAHANVWVVGGASVFEQTISQADELYLTEIAADFGCDQFFPDFLPHEFELAEQSEPQEQNGFHFTYKTYKRLS